ncbi:MAG: Bax inhibitor-1 family protein [Caulobacteraceae bacterium]|nr:Bax inhibitor-1 family protein [Caulobacteraceae bacterium]
MSDFQGHHIQVPSSADMAVDQGLRKFLIGVYNKLFLGLLVAAAVAYAGASSPAFMQAMYRFEGDQFAGYTAVGWIVGLAPIGIILLSGALMRSAMGAMLTYWLIVALVGASTAVYLALFTGPSIAVALLAASIGFLGLSVMGYVTKRNLSGIGNLMGLAMWGLVASFILLPLLGGGLPPMVFLAMCGIGIVLTAVLIAATTQQMKLAYYATAGHAEMMTVASYDAALSLFVQFVNLFRFILMFVGVRR